MENNSNKIVLTGIFMFIIELIPQVLGWLTFHKQYIIKNTFCTYYMNGNSWCPLFFNGFNNNKTYQYCYQFEDDCQPANLIRKIYIASLCLPLITIVLIYLVFCLRNNYKKQLWIKGIWIVISISSIALILCVIIITDLFANESSFQVNIWIRDQSWIIFSIRIFQFVILACFFYYFSAQQLPDQPNQQPDEPYPEDQNRKQNQENIREQQKQNKQVYPEDQNDVFFTQPILNPIDEDLHIR